MSNQNASFTQYNESADSRDPWATQANRKRAIGDMRSNVGSYSVWSGTCQSEIAKSGSDHADHYALCLLANDGFTLDLESRRFVSEPDCAIAGNWSEIIEHLHRDERRCLGLAFSKDHLSRQLNALIGVPLVRKPELSAFIERGSTTLSKISALSALLWGSLTEECERRTSAQFVELLSSSMLLLVLHDIPHNYSSELTGSTSPAIPRHVKLALEFMMENISSPISVDDIAQASRVSRRTLHLGFSRFLDTTPLQYLRKIRLQGAHRELSSSKGAVAEIARRWGFTHPGYFTAYYREAFGQTPSDTVRAAREGR